MTNAFGQCGDGAQILFGGLCVLAPQELRGVVRVGTDRRDGLVDLVGDPRGNLSQQGQLAGLDKFVLHRVQARLGALPFVHFVHQLLIELAQLAGAFTDQCGQLRLDGGLLASPFAVAMAPIEHDADRSRQQALHQQGGQLCIGDGLVHDGLDGRQ
ncbi:hypothetical protein D3C71_1368580 [compost metagenome]